jgi:hypothetical protein
MTDDLDEQLCIAGTSLVRIVGQPDSLSTLAHGTHSITASAILTDAG